MDYRNYIGCFLSILSVLAIYAGDGELAIVFAGVGFFAAMSVLHDHWMDAP